MVNRRVTQNNPFKGQPNVRRGAGPEVYKWSPTPFQKTNEINKKAQIGCNNYIDNIVTYVYDVLPDGNHLSYVFCDYVE